VAWELWVVAPPPGYSAPARPTPAAAPRPLAVVGGLSRFRGWLHPGCWMIPETGESRDALRRLLAQAHSGPWRSHCAPVPQSPLEECLLATTCPGRAQAPRERRQAVKSVILGPCRKEPPAAGSFRRDRPSPWGWRFCAAAHPALIFPVSPIRLPENQGGIPIVVSRLRFAVRSAPRPTKPIAFFAPPTQLSKAAPGWAAGGTPGCALRIDRGLCQAAGVIPPESPPRHQTGPSTAVEWPGAGGMAPTPTTARGDPQQQSQAIHRPPFLSEKSLPFNNRRRPVPGP